MAFVNPILEYPGRRNFNVTMYRHLCFDMGHLQQHFYLTNISRTVNDLPGKYCYRIIRNIWEWSAEVFVIVISLSMTNRLEVKRIDCYSFINDAWVQSRQGSIVVIASSKTKHTQMQSVQCFLIVINSKLLYFLRYSMFILSWRSYLRLE